MNRLQRWICDRAPWLSHSCWPPPEYTSTDGEPVERSGSDDPMKARYDQEAREIARTLKILDAQIDVVAGTNRLKDFSRTSKPKQKPAHEGGLGKHE